MPDLYHFIGGKRNQVAQVLHNSKSISVTAPNGALLIALAYLASTAQVQRAWPTHLPFKANYVHVQACTFICQYP
jgi:hypothetical protein